MEVLPFYHSHTYNRVVLTTEYPHIFLQLQQVFCSSEEHETTYPQRSKCTNISFFTCSKLADYLFYCSHFLFLMQSCKMFVVTQRQCKQSRTS